MHHLESAPSELTDHELFAAAIGTDDESERWHFVDELRQRGSRSIVDRAMLLIGSADRRQRLVAIDVLNDFGATRGFPFRDEYTPVLISALATSDVEELENIIAAVGKTGDPRARQSLLDLVTHPSATVRLRLSQALPAFADDDIPENDPLVESLLTLMGDIDGDVRDWATFGIGTALTVDGPTVRAALRASLNADGQFDNSRSEALAGLVIRREPGIVHEVLAMLTGGVVPRLAVECAGLLGDPRLHSVLSNLSTWWDIDPERLSFALERCDPGRVPYEVAVMSAMQREAVTLDPTCELVFAVDRFDRETSVMLKSDSRLLGPWSLADVLKSCDDDIAKAVRAMVLTP